MKIVLIGAGSSSFGRGQIADIVQAEEFRGRGVTLTLVDLDGVALPMGTEFDAFTPASHHASSAISAEAQRNRLILLGLMTQSGWDFYRNEWWHYQLFNSRDYPLISNGELPRPML